MSSSYVGLDLGTYSIKLVEIQREGQAIAVVQALEAKIPQDPRVSREEAQHLVLEEQFSADNLERKPVICAFPGHLASLRVLKLPITDRKKLEKIIPFEIESYIPVELDKIHHDWEILQTLETPEGQESHVLAVSIFREQFEKFFNTLQMAQLDPREITLDAMSLGYLLDPSFGPGSHFPQEPGHAIALMDCGHSKTNICVVAGGQPVYCRTIGVAGREITAILEQDFKLSFLEAETLKQTDGMIVTRPGPGISPESERLSKSIRRVVDELAAELRQTVVNCEESHGLSIEEFHLFGGTAGLKNLASYLSATVNVPFKRQNYFLLQDIQNFSDDQAFSLTPAFALALRGAHNKPAKNINFRKGVYRVQHSYQSAGAIVKKFASLAALVLFFLALNFMGKSIILGQKIRSAEKSIEKSVKSLDPSYVFKGTQHALSACQNRGGGGSGENSPCNSLAQGQSPLLIYKALSQNIPRTVTVTVTDLSIDYKSVVLEGITDSRESVGKIRESLSQNEDFKNVTEDRVAKSAQGFDFKLTLSLQDQETPGG